MKRIFRNLLALALLPAGLLLSCSKPENGGSGHEGPDNPEGGENIGIPEPPEDIVAENLFHVDFLTDLSDAPYMASHTLDDVRNYIGGDKGYTPVMYFIDGLEFEAGKASELVRWSYSLSMKSFFAQSGPTSAKTRGRGIMTKRMVDIFDGVCTADKVFMSGCEIKVPLHLAETVVLYTAGISSVRDAEGLVKSRPVALSQNGILIGTVKKGTGEELKEYIETKAGCRLELSGLESADNDLFVMTPVTFVCRNIAYEVADSKVGRYKIEIEKLY